MVLDSFMESYNRNVVIKGNDSELAAFFEGVQPCTYEEAIETFFEAQYSVEAMLAITNNAIMMESAGAAEVVTENVVGDFFRAAADKVKECATKVKQFAVAIIKKIIQFFKELYAKSTPIDKVMQRYGKNPVTFKEIQEAQARGYKIPATLKILTADADAVRKDIFDKTCSKDQKNIETVVKKLEALSAQAFSSAGGQQGAISHDENIKAINDQLDQQKELDKEKFTWVGQLISDNDSYTKNSQFKNFFRYAGGNDSTSNSKSGDGHITDAEWKSISDFALTGQQKQREYKAQVEQEAKDSVSKINEAMKALEKAQADAKKASNNNADGNKSLAAENKLAAAYVRFASYSAQRSTMVMSKVIIPVMRKMHSASIATYISITSSVRSSKRKQEKEDKKNNS